MRTKLMLMLALSLLIEACSSRPREFTPMLGAAPMAAPVDQAKVDEAVATCKQLLVTGKLDSNGRLASGGAGAAAGGAVGAAGVAAATSAGLYGGMAVLSATMVLMPFAIIGGAVGMAKIKRKKKERAIQAKMVGCLHDHGYDVLGWERTPKPARIAPARP